MRTLARTMRDMYAALTNEGFTEAQALVLLGSTIAAGMAANKKDEGS